MSNKESINKSVYLPNGNPCIQSKGFIEKYIIALKNIHNMQSEEIRLMLLLLIR